MNNQSDSVQPKGVSRRSVVLNVGLAVAGLSLPSSFETHAQERPNSDVKGDGRMTVGMVVFDGFQLLDTFGPLEMFAGLRNRVRIVIIAERPGLIASSAGPTINADYTFSNVPKLDVLLIPGGEGTRREVNNVLLVEAVKTLALDTPNVASICTGAAILARSGLLDGLNATTNKRAFKWATDQGQKVKWVKQARWVEDGKYFTSSGISAGMDMSLAMIAKLFGHDTALRVANGAEYHWNSDPSIDPFAKLNGLTD